MAIFKALTFDGVNSLDYGIYITGEAVYNAPERAVEMVNIPGKNGALALDQGRFENIEVTYHAGCFADNQADFADKVMKFRNALASRYTYKRLTDEYHPDEYRLGLYKSGLEVDAVRYSTAGEFNITFDCKPQRFLVDGDREILPTEWSDVQTESGELVTIESDGSLAVKSLAVSLSPIQDLNGYDKPWVGGAGKNKLAPSTVGSATTNGITFKANADGSVTITGTATANAYMNMLNWSALSSTSLAPYAGQSVALSGGTSQVRLTLAIRASSSSAPTESHDTGSGATVTLPSDTSYQVYCALRVLNGQTIDTTVYPMIRLASVSDATYEPYSNICPISGRTEVVTQRTGKNLIDAVSGSNNLVVGSIRAGETYTFSVRNRGVCGFNLKKNNNSGEVIIVKPRSASSVVAATFTADEDCGLFLNGFGGNGYTFSDNAYNYQLELGSTATDYEPYQGDTYTTDLGRTVYGGTLDVVSGVLTVDRAMVDLGSLSWTQDGTAVSGASRFYASLSPTAKTADSVNLTAISSAYSLLASGGTYSASATGFTIASNGRAFVYDASAKSMTASAFKTYVNGKQLVYKLATPQTIQLTPQQIDLLLGTNHLWSDGEITVEYGVHPYYNPTPFASKPLIKVTGTGTLGIGEYILTITGTASQTLYIDCETMEIYTLEGTVPAGASSLVSINKNDFPVLEPGTNYISVGSGITDVTITPRWWRI